MYSLQFIASLILNFVQDAGLPQTFEEALTRVRASSSDLDGFAFLGKFENK